MPRPDTATVELRTDTIEQLIGLLEMKELGVVDFPTDQRMAVAHRLRRQLEDGEDLERIRLEQMSEV